MKTPNSSLGGNDKSESSTANISADTGLSPYSGSEANTSPVRSRQSPSVSSSQQQQGLLYQSQQNPNQSQSEFQFEDDFSDQSEVILAKSEYLGSSANHREQYYEKFNQKSKNLEEIALRSILQLHFGYIPFATAKKCLAAYWAWIHPIHLTIHRPSFLRDMAVYSPDSSYNQNSCFSLALLSGIFSETVPLLYGKDCELAKILDQHSHSLLMQDILFPATLATVASVMHKAIGSLKRNNLAQFWILSGIAYRLAEDLELYLPPDQHNPLVSIEYVEARARLAWALFYWDQNISLYLSRLPTINAPPFSIDEYILDYSNDNEIWVPILEPKGEKLLSMEIMRIAAINSANNNEGSSNTSTNTNNPTSINTAATNTAANSRRSSIAAIPTTSSNLSTPTPTKTNLKRSSSGNLKSDSYSAKRKSVPGKLSLTTSGISSSNLAFIEDPQIKSVSNSTASIKLKLSILLQVNRVISSIFGDKKILLSSGIIEVFKPSYSLNHAQVTEIQESIDSLKLLWEQNHDLLKINEAFPPPIGASINPSNLASCIHFHASLLLMHNYLLYDSVNSSENIKRSHDDSVPTDNCNKDSEKENSKSSSLVDDALSSISHIIIALSIYINYFGEFHINHWHELAPFICAQYLLTLLKLKTPSSAQESKAKSYLKAILKLLIKPVFQIPNLAQMLSSIESVISSTNSLMTQHNVTALATTQSQNSQTNPPKHQQEQETYQGFQHSTFQQHPPLIQQSKLQPYPINSQVAVPVHVQSHVQLQSHAQAQVHAQFQAQAQAQMRAQAQAQAQIQAAQVAHAVQAVPIQHQQFIHHPQFHPQALQPTLMGPTPIYQPQVMGQPPQTMQFPRHPGHNLHISPSGISMISLDPNTSASSQGYSAQSAPAPPQSQYSIKNEPSSHSSHQLTTPNLQPSTINMTENSAIDSAFSGGGGGGNADGSYELTSGRNNSNNAQQDPNSHQQMLISDQSQQQQQQTSSTATGETSDQSHYQLDHLQQMIPQGAYQYSSSSELDLTARTLSSTDPFFSQFSNRGEATDVNSQQPQTIPIDTQLEGGTRSGRQDLHDAILWTTGGNVIEGDESHENNKIHQTRSDMLTATTQSRPSSTHPTS